MRGSAQLAQDDYLIDDHPVKVDDRPVMVDDRPDPAVRPDPRRPRTLDAAIKVWIATLKSNEKRPRTLQNYEEVARTLPDVWPLDQWTLLGWWHKLADEDREGGPLLPSTRTMRAKIVRGFCLWAATTGVLAENPFVRSGIVPPKPPVGEPRKKIFTQEELDALLSPRPRSWWEHRLHVMMHVALQGALRASELCGSKESLAWTDVEFDHPEVDMMLLTLRITKGSGIHGKPEEVVLRGPSVGVLRQWYRTQERFGQAGPTKYVFPTAAWQHEYRKRLPHFTGKPYGRQMFCADLKAFAKHVGITRTVHPHMFRHTAITEFYKQSGDVEATRIFARHKNANTTRLYMDTDKVREHVLELQRKFTPWRVQ